MLARDSYVRLTAHLGKGTIDRASWMGLSILLSIVFSLVNLLLFDQTIRCANLALPPFLLKRTLVNDCLRGSASSILVFMKIAHQDQVGLPKIQFEAGNSFKAKL